MRKHHLFIAIITVVAAALPAVAPAADQPGTAEARLRDMLKNTTLQLRNAQNDLATAQATAAEDEQKVKDLQDQNAALTKQAIVDKDASDKAIADLNKKNTDQAALLDTYKDALAKWKAVYKLAATAAQQKEGERVRLNSENIVLQRRVDDLETKNLSLFQIGSEVLVRYEKFGLGEALAAKEPFVGATRVKLENQVQDYQDKLQAQKSTPPAADATGAPAPAQGAAKQGEQHPATQVSATGTKQPPQQKQ